MTKTLATRIAILTLIAGVVVAVPGPAKAAIFEQAGAAMRFLDEIVIGAAALGALILADTATWPFMTKSR